MTTPAPSPTHYENFPVASWLCPPRLRPAIAAIYHFARTADDLADEGDASPAQRLAELAQYRQDLHACASGQGWSVRWAAVFAPLQVVIAQHQLPLGLLDDLLSAFMQDVDFTHAQRGYADRQELLDYCRRSANPVGRLLLHLYQVHDATSLAQSDAVCSALQLINFWQDLSEDLPRGRFYLTEADCQRHGISRPDLLAAHAGSGPIPPAIAQLITESMQWARKLMLQGQPLAQRLPGRIGWELRLVVQGGLCIADKVLAQNGASLRQRLTVGKRDLPRMLWRAWRMPAA